MTGAAAAQGPVLDYDTIFGDGGRDREPLSAQWLEDGSALFFRYRDDDGAEIWRWRRGNARAERLLEAKALRSGSETVSYASFKPSPDGTSLVFLHSGDLYLWTVGAPPEARRLTRAEDDDEDPKFSPDGSRIAFVRGANLWLVELASGAERRLTSSGVPGELLFGKTDWVYWEELWGRDSTGFWWSPDGGRIALYRFDESAVGRYPILDPLPTDPTVTWQAYPRAGTANPTVAVGTIDLDSGDFRRMDTGDDADIYLPRVTWLADGSELAIHRLNRAQNRLDLLLCDPATGAARVHLSEVSSTWIDIEDDFRFLADGRLLWGSDRDGWRRLYLYDAAGANARVVSPEGTEISALDAAWIAAGDLHVVTTGFDTAGLGAKDRAVTLSVVRGDAVTHRPLSDAGGWHTAKVAPDGSAYVLTSAAANDGRSTTLLAMTGDPVAELPQESGVDRRSLPRWEFLEVPAADGSSLPARLLRPPGFDPAHRYPVIMYHYGGPTSQQVVDDAPARPVRDLWHVRQAQRGYVVFMADNQASKFFGKIGAARIQGHFGPLELQAQKDAAAWLRSQPWVDGDHIGLWGWSGGGANTLYSLFRSPGTWAAGVAGAPVTDWRLYDSIWTERYMGHPDDNASGYEEASPITYADQLRDPLLVVHGTGDDNVHPSNSFALSQKLIEAGLPFDHAFYPRQKHGFGDPQSRHFYERMERFFDLWLRQTQ